MAVSFNKVIIAGNLTRDPQVRFFANERAVADFGIACNRRYKGQDGEMKEETTFVDIEAWGRTAELVGQYLTKGRAALVEGRLRLDNWEDKDGNKRSKLKVVADTVQFLDSRGGGGGGGGGGSEEPASSGATGGGSSSAALDDEPPF